MRIVHLICYFEILIFCEDIYFLDNQIKIQMLKQNYSWQFTRMKRCNFQER